MKRVIEMSERIWLKAFLLMLVSQVSAGDAQQPAVHDGGSKHVPAFELPVSSFLTPEARRALDKWESRLAQIAKACPSGDKNLGSMAARRRCHAEKLYPAWIAEFTSRYKVRIQPVKIGGIATEIIMPAEGVPARHQDLVLINVHGGGFVAGGGGHGGQVESIPIAAAGKFKVVSVDYRLAPEFAFPAARDDVVAVYRALLEEYAPASIGIFGCSAGAVLTAQTLAWLQKEGLPAPGAIGMFCGAGAYFSEGDSGQIIGAIQGSGADQARRHPYLKNTDPNDPVVFPLRSDEVLAKFPPSLLISGTRDIAMSSVVHMHSRLVALGVEARLHIWEGMDHAFFYEPTFPQSSEMYDVVAQFFDRRLQQ
jgi:epsilon-lactone hydrolase